MYASSFVRVICANRVSISLSPIHTADADADWIEQGLTSPPTQIRLSGRQFYRSKDGLLTCKTVSRITYTVGSFKDPTNSIKVLKEKLASHSTEEAQNPPRASHRVTSEPLKRKTISVGQAHGDKAPHSRLACTSPV